MPRLILAAFVVLALWVPADAGGDRLATMAAAHDYFGLRAELAKPAARRTVDAPYYAAIVASAFGQDGEADRTIGALLSQSLPSGWRRQLLETRMHSRLRRFDYAGALADAHRLVTLREPGDPPAAGAEPANMVDLLTPMRDIPKQSATPVTHEVHLRLPADAAGGYCAPVLIGKHARCLAFDSGANFSILIRSQAKALGLRIRSSGARIGSSTGAGVAADIAVVPYLHIGPVTLRHVVFLVLPDAAMTFSGTGIQGLLGLPVLRGLGRVRFNADQSIDLLPPAHPETPNIAMDGQQLLVQAVFKGAPQLCALDSGAGLTVFYKSFYTRYTDWLDRNGYRHRVHLGGAGGVRVLEAVRIPELAIELTGQAVTLHSVDVFVHDVRPDQPHLMCNIGLDALESGQAYTLDLRNQTLGLE